MSAGELIPTDGLDKMDVAPVNSQTARMGQSGDSVVTVLGPTLWKLQGTTVRLSLLQARKWSAFLNRRQQRAYSFTAWRLQRVNPLRAVGTADGSIGITVDAANNQISLSGCGAYLASVGDMISWRTLASGFCLVEVQADASAVAGAVTLDVLPKPLAAHATPAVRRVQALGEFELTTVLDPFEDYTNRALSFEAQQILR